MKALLKRRHVYVQKHKRTRLRRRITSLGISVTILLAVSFTAAGIANAKRHANSLSKVVFDAKSTSQNAHPRSTKKSATKNTSGNTLPNAVGSPLDTALTTSCTLNKPVNTGLSASTESHLRIVAEYDGVLCKSTVSSSLIFTDMPRTNDEADQLAAQMSSTLSSFAQANILPTVVVEPKYGSEKLDLANLQTSTAGSVFEYYLSSLKAKGISDTQAGTWIFFPEPNIPKWTTVDPIIFTTNFTLFGTLFKEYFKTSAVGVLFNSTTYASGDPSGSGSYASLLPYVSSLPAGLVDSFGYEGFPWTPPATSKENPVINASDFLKTSLVAEAVAALGVHSVWISTGTFASYYMDKAADMVTMTPIGRSKLLDDIAAQAVKLQKSGLNVTVDLFTKDESAGSAAVDWSYWPAGKAGGSDGAIIINQFADSLSAAGITFGVY